MKRILSIVLYASLAGLIPLGSSAMNIGELITKIKDTEKVEQLYNIRYNLSKLKSRPDLDLRTQDSLRIAMVLLTRAFADYRHYRNAIDSYREYIAFNKKYLEQHLVHFTDSIRTAHSNYSATGNQKLQELTTEISTLEKRQDAVASLKGKYYFFGGIAGIAILVFSLLLAIAKSRTISQVNNRLSENRGLLSSLHHRVTDALMLQGTLAFYKIASEQEAEILEDIHAQIATETNSRQIELTNSAISAAIKALRVSKS